MRKRILSLGLSLALLLSLLPGTVWAVETEPKLTQQSVDLKMIQTSALPGISAFSLSDGTLTNNGGSHEMWFDRITFEGDVQTAMNKLYQVLEEGSDHDGTADYLIDNTYFSYGNDLATYAAYQALTADDVGKVYKTDDFSGIYVGSIAGSSDSSAATYWSKAISATYQAFDRDHPEVFWLNGKSSVMKMTWSGSSTTTYLFFTLYQSDLDVRNTTDYSAGETAIESAIEKRDQDIAKIMDGTTSVEVNGTALTYQKDGTAYDNVRFFNAWLTHNNQYNTAVAANNSNAAPKSAWECISALAGSTGTNGPVCEGYARAMKVLCDQAEIPCVLVDGTAKSSPDASSAGPHMWNYTEVDGAWYGVDVTWNDPVVVGGGSHENENYLLVGSATEIDNQTFIASHPVTNQVSTSGVVFDNGPVLSGDKYVPKAPISGTVTISGTAKIDEKLTASTSNTPADATLKYQWYRGDTAIDGATESTYTPTTAADVGQTIQVQVTAEGYSGKLEASTSAAVVKGDYAEYVIAPTNYTATYHSITIYPVGEGYEYACTPDQNASLDGLWQDALTMENLTPSTTYYIYSRVKETATHNASQRSNTLIVTTKAAPISEVTVAVDAPVKGAVLDADATVSVPASGVTAAVTWYEGSAVEGAPVSGAAKANQVYTVQITLTADEDNSFASPVTATDGYTVQSADETKVILTKTFPATQDKAVQRIEITTPPAKTEYVEGEIFDPAGMVVTATYDDGSKAEVTNYTVPSTPLTAEITQITVTYGDKTATISGIKVLQKPTADDFQIALSTEATYTGKPQAATIQANATVAGMGAVTIKYNGSEMAPTNAGTYTVTFDVAKGENYAAATGLSAGTFTIAKAEQEALTIDSAASVTYGKTLTLTTTGGSTDGVVTYSVTNGTGSAAISGSTLTPTKAGTVTVTATKAGDTNYNAVTSAEVTITIDKAEATADMKTATSTIVAGKSSSVTLPALPDGASYGTVSLGASTTSEMVVEPKVSGNQLAYTGGEAVEKDTRYTVTISVAESTNYQAYTITVTLIGSEKLTPVLTVNPIVVTYTGNQVPATAITGTAKVGDTVVEGTWNWSTAAIPPKDVEDSGSYHVFFTPADTDTYAVAFGTVQVTINKATPTGTPTYTAITTSGKTLADANLQIGSITPGGGQITWNLGSTTVVTANTAYTWTYTPTDPANYNLLTGAITPWVCSTNPGGGSSSGGSSSSGTQTDTTKNPDGSTTTTVTKPDGTVTTTTTDKSGNKTQTVEKPNGATVTTVDKKDGSSSTTTVSASGTVEATVDLSENAVISAASQGQAVALPMPSVPVTTRRTSAPTVTVNLPVGSSAQVEIPVEDVTAGTVAILVKADGSEQVIKTSLTTDNGVAVTLKDGDTVKIVDNSKSFYDVSSYYWGADAIDFATSREIFAGTSGTTFSPDLSMNRAMIVTVLAAYEGVNTTSTSGVWYDVGRQWAMEQGISDGTNMNDSLTREQLATMLWRYAGSPIAGSSLSGYVDSGDVSGYAAQAMAWAVENGLISGMNGNALAPQGTATRAQVATILMRFVENQNG